jgi:hypothetical protein
MFGAAGKNGLGTGVEGLSGGADVVGSLKQVRVNPRVMFGLAWPSCRETNTTLSPSLISVEA